MDSGYIVYLVNVIAMSLSCEAVISIEVDLPWKACIVHATSDMTVLRSPLIGLRRHLSRIVLLLALEE